MLKANDVVVRGRNFRHVLEDVWPGPARVRVVASVSSVPCLPNGRPNKLLDITAYSWDNGRVVAVDAIFEAGWRPASTMQNTGEPERRRYALAPTRCATPFPR